MDTENKDNNTLLGVIVVVLVVLLISLVSYLIFFLPEDVKNEVEDTQENMEDVVVEDTEEDVVVDDTKEDTKESENVVVEEQDSTATDLEETEVQVTYMGDSSEISGYVYFENASGDKYFMNGLSLTSVDVDREFVIKIESEEEIDEGKKVSGEVYYFKVLTYMGSGDEISEDYADYIYFEVKNDSSTEVYFLKNYGLSLYVGGVYEFMFSSLEELDAAAGTSYWKMNGRFEYSSR